MIQTTSGAVRGFVDTHALVNASSVSLPPIADCVAPVQKFLGIPFGRAGRWEQAVPFTTTENDGDTEEGKVRDCVEFGPACPQLPGVLTARLKALSPGMFPRNHVGISEVGEEMLTVNVFCSDGVKQGDDVPVMVWIYGGSWKDGAASGLVYDPTNLVRSAGRPMIVVTLNYRVNIFGFLASKDLVDEDGLVGNYGIRDQLLALKWVNRNIAHFGGDKGNVTIFGESAGAASVGWQVGGIDPLFRRAIAQSGGASTMGYQSVETHEKLWHLLLTHFGIDLQDPERVQKARAISMPDLLKFQAANPSLQWAACVESGPKAIWAAHPDVRIAKGEYVESLESLMLGCTQDEGSIFAEFFGMTASQKVVDKFLGAFGEATPHIKKYYSGIEDVASYKGNLVDHPASRFLHDALFDGPVRFFAETVSSTPHARTGREVAVYLYKSEAILPAWETLDWGAHHFSEVPFVFNSASLWDNDPSSPEAKTAECFGGKWTSFAFTGCPGSDWPRYTADDKRRMVLENGGRQRVEEVSAGASEMGLFMFGEIIRARWGIEEKKNETMSKM